MDERIITDSLRAAAADYLLLAERDYSRTAALKLVGDHYRLSAVQRSILYRGIQSSSESRRRTAKRVDDVDSAKLCVDGFNILYTIANYLYGRPLFISTDGWLRDAGEVHGAGFGASVKGREILERSTEIAVKCRYRGAEKSPRGCGNASAWPA